MYCKIKNCNVSTSGKSKYCKGHKRVARQKWLETVQRDADDRRALAARFHTAFTEAYEAGVAAGSACVPEPMHIVGYEPISEGVCGFAWVTIRPGNCKAANYAKKTFGYRPAYGGGVSYWVSEYGQSYERKIAFARAYADVLREHLRKLDPRASVHAGGRLD